MLAQHFIEHFNREYDRQIRGLSPSAIERIRNYHWPGNIRQIKNTIEPAVLVESDEWIEAEDLILDTHRDAKPEPKTEAPPPSLVTSGLQIEIPEEGIALEELERNIIFSALVKADHNISKAARLLKISRGKLRYRMERLGIDAPETKSSVPV